MTVWRHSSGRELTLCFGGCQHFPEPFNRTGLSDEWERVDPWRKIRRQPRLQVDYPGHQKLETRPAVRKMRRAKLRRHSWAPSHMSYADHPWVVCRVCGTECPQSAARRGGIGPCNLSFRGESGGGGI